jgi:hypothetical protein
LLRVRPDPVVGDGGQRPLDCVDEGLSLLDLLLNVHGLRDIAALERDATPLLHSMWRYGLFTSTTPVRRLAAQRLNSKVSTRVADGQIPPRTHPAT